MSIDDSKVTEVLFDRGTLMDLYIGKPTFQRKLRASDVLLEGINEEVIYLGHKKLLPKKAMERLVTLEGTARKTLSDRSLEFPLSGARFVYYRALPEVLTQLRSLKVEWGQAVTELVQQYPELKREQLIELDAQCEKLVQKELAKYAGADRQNREKELQSWLEQQRINNRNLYPNVDELSSMFTFDWRMFKVSALSGLEEMSSLDQSDILAAQRQLQDDLQKWVRTAAVEMHKTLGEAAANALGILGRQEKMHPRNLKPLFDAFENFKAIDFTGSSSFQDVVEQIKKQFGVTGTGGALDYDRIANRVNETSSGMEEFRALLSKVGELAVDKVAEEAGINAVSSVGQLKRLIEV